MLDELHSGTCGSHSGWRALVHKALRNGHFWMTMRADAQEVARTCGPCQFHAPVSHRPGVEMQVITGPCPFALWGLDLLGPFPKVPGQYTMLIVAIDYFTKWIEAVPLVKTTVSAVQKFLWQNIICRFGLPQ